MNGPPSSPEEPGQEIKRLRDNAERQAAAQALLQGQEVLRQVLLNHDRERQSLADEIDNALARQLEAAVAQLEDSRRLHQEGKAEAAAAFHRGLARPRHAREETRRCRLVAVASGSTVGQTYDGARRLGRGRWIGRDRGGRGGGLPLGDPLHQVLDQGLHVRDRIEDSSINTLALEVEQAARFSSSDSQDRGHHVQGARRVSRATAARARPAPPCFAGDRRLAGR